MKVLVIGGTRFLGPAVVRRLVANGHAVTLFRRGQTSGPPCPGARTITGDRKELHRHSAELGRLAPDVILDMIPFTPEDAQGLMEAARGMTPRVVALSSIDVYLAYGRIHRTEPGPLVPVPLDETSPLRSTDLPHGRAYDKISVERHVMGTPSVDGTILRLPAIYGPGDYQHRFFKHLKRIANRRPAILLAQGWDRWRFSHGYVENVAHAVVLAVEREEARGRVYNVGESDPPSQKERIERLGAVTGWKGRVVVVPRERCPDHLKSVYEGRELDPAQDWVVGTSRIRSELAYREVVPEEQALRETIVWELAHPPSLIDPKEYDYAAEDAALLDPRP